MSSSFQTISGQAEVESEMLVAVVDFKPGFHPHRLHPSNCRVRQGRGWILPCPRYQVHLGQAD